MMLEPSNQQQQPTIPAAIATVAQAESDGTPDVLEVDGVLFRREVDQKHARAVCLSARSAGDRRFPLASRGIC